MAESLHSIPLSEEEVQKQLEILGYHDFNPRQLKQITRDLQMYLANDSVTTDTDESILSVTDSTSYYEMEGMDRRPLADVRYPAKMEKPKSIMKVPSRNYGKENVRHLAIQSRPDPTNSDAYSEESSVFSETGDERDVHQHPKKPERRPFMKRKVVRKRNGESQVFDESITESDSDVSYINERLADLHIPTKTQGDVHHPPQHERLHPGHHGNDNDSASDSSSVCYGHSRRARSASPSVYSHRLLESEDGVYKPHLPRSFIRPLSAQPKTKHDKKTDPVTRHQMYQSHWKAYKAPGEKNHKGLRWSIREQMLYKDDVVLPKSNHRVYVPNSYKVPTEKKRQALRWAVRNSLANREMPYSTFQF